MGVADISLIHVKQTVAYHLAALGVYVGGMCLTESLSVKLLQRFASTDPVAYICWALGVLFACYFTAGCLSFYRRSSSLPETAFLSVFTAFISTLFTLVVFILAAQWNFISIN